MAGALGGDHDDVDVLRRGDGLEVDVEAVSEGQGLALGHVGGDLAVVDVSAQLVGNQHHHNVAGLGSLFDFHDLEVLVGGGELRGFLPVGRAFAQTDDDVDAALGQVFGVGVALGTKTDDSNRLAVENAEVAVGIIILVDSHGGCLLFNVEFFYF